MIFRVPTHTGKPGKLREVFPVREESGNFKILPESQESIWGKNVCHHWILGTKVLTQFNYLRVVLKLLFVNIERKYLFFMICGKKSGENVKNTGKVREFLKSKKVGTLHFVREWQGILNFEPLVKWKLKLKAVSCDDSISESTSATTSPWFLNTLHCWSTDHLQITTKKT